MKHRGEPRQGKRPPVKPARSRARSRRHLEIYKAIFDPQEEGGYTVTIPSLPGCISEGNTFEEALANIKEAMALYLESLAADRRPIPRETRLVVEIESPSGPAPRRERSPADALRVTVSMHRGDVKRGTLAALIDAAGLTEDEFLKLL